MRWLVLVAFAPVTLITLASVTGWIARWRRTSWLFVACVINTALLTMLLLTVETFRSEGLTLYSLAFAAVMFWTASRAAHLGTTAFKMIKERPDSQ